MTVACYLTQAAAALQAAHEQRVIHRDIKPANMLLGARNEVLLTDFGIAVMLQAMRSFTTREAVGTIAYIAPEQIQERPRPASDQYALAVVAYEWLTGTVPFEGTFTEVAVKHVYAPPPPLRSRVPTLSPAVEQVVLTALAKDPQQRFASVQAFAEAFACAAGDRRLFPAPIRARPATEPTLAAPLSRSLVGSSDLPTEPAPEIPGNQPLLTYRGHSDGVSTLSWSPDGMCLASGSRDHTVQVWEVKSGTTLMCYRGHRGKVLAVAWSPDGARLASGEGDQGNLHLWEAATGRTIFTCAAHSGWLLALAWSPDGTRLASGGVDRTVQMREVIKRQLLFTYRGHTRDVSGLAWSPDGTRLASASLDKTVQVQDAANGKQLVAYQAHADAVQAVAWAPDSTRIASGSLDGTVQVWMADGRPIGTYRNHTGGVLSAAWSPDGQRIASGDRDGAVQVWEAATGTPLLTYRSHTRLVNAVAWSPDGMRLATASDDGIVQVWQIP